MSLAGVMSRSCLVQAWGCLERKCGNIGLARSMFKCAIKADPSSKQAWEVRQTPAPCATSCQPAGVLVAPGKEAAHAAYCNAWHPACNQILPWMQAWMNMERDLGEDNRAYAISRMRAAGRTDVPLPDSFQLPSDLAEGDEQNALEAVVKTVRTPPPTIPDLGGRLRQPVRRL